MTKTLQGSERKISVNFRNRLANLMDDSDITKTNLSKEANVSIVVLDRALIYSIIPTVRILIRLADYFDVPLLYLLGETDERDFYKSDNPVTFHERLEALTNESGTTYSKIANEMPFERNFFFEWQRAKTLPSIDYLIEIAKYFNVSVDYLLGRTDYKK